MTDLSAAERAPVGGIEPSSTALTLIRVFNDTILQSTVKFAPPLADVALWQETHLELISVFTAVNKGPAVPEHGFVGVVGGVTTPVSAILSPLLHE